jgi:hypothetical protein
MARRLLVALILSLLISIAVYVVLPRYGVVLPAWIPLLAFLTMVAGSIAIALENDAEKDEDRPEVIDPNGPYYSDAPPPDPDDLVRFDDEARPITCCGPRPVGEASKRVRSAQGRQGAHGGSCCG